MTNKISEKDKKDWDNFIKSSEKVPNKDVKSKEKKTFKTKSIDLHGYTLDEANKAIEDFINKIFLRKTINKLNSCHW